MAKEKKKLLFVYGSMVVGGSTTALLSILKCIDYEKFSVDLMLYKNGGPLLDYVPEQVRLLPLAYRYGEKTAKIRKMIRLLFKGYLFRYVVDRIRYGKTAKTAEEFQARELSRGIPEVYDCAIGFLEGWSDRYVAYHVNAKKKIGWLHSTFSNITADPRTEFAWMKRVDRIALVSEAVLRNFCEDVPAFAEKAIFVKNVLCEDLIRARAEETDTGAEILRTYPRPKFITVCRADARIKGLDRILRAIAVLKEKGYWFLWCLVGDGADLPTLKCEIEKSGLQEYVFCAGQQKNPYPWMKECDFFCLASRVEGKPCTVTEAQILGLPCVVTEYFSAGEQITDGKDGLIVPNEDGGILIGLEKLLGDPGCLEKLKENVVQGHYGNESYMAEIEKLFAE